MSIANPRARRSPAIHSRVTPQLGFAAAILVALGAWASTIATLPADYGLPILASVFLTLGVLFGAIAWRARDVDPTNVTYADVSGALVLIGLGASALIDPDQLLRIIGAIPTAE